MSYAELDEMFFRQLCKASSSFANPTFLRCLTGILQRCFLAKMSKNCLCEMCYIPLYEMPFRQLCKISSRFSNPTSFRRLKDILSTRCLECLHKTSLRCLFADNDMLYVLAVFIYVPYQSLIQVNLTNVWTIASRNCRG